MTTQEDSVIIIHNSMKLYRQIRERNPNAKLVMHMHNAFEPEIPDKERHQIAEKAKSLVFSKYSWENVAQRFEEQMKNWFDK